jgi:hypothetical protein
MAIAGKAGEPVLYIGCVTDFGRFSIADTVDADLDLPAHCFGNGLRHHTIEFNRIECFTLFFLEE